MKRTISILTLTALIAVIAMPIKAEYSFKRGAASVLEYMQTKDGRPRTAFAAASLTAGAAGIYWLCKNSWNSTKPAKEKAKMTGEDKKRIAAKVSILAALTAIGSFIFESHNMANYFNKN